MLRVLLFNLERSDLSEHFGFDVKKAPDETIPGPEINNVKNGSCAEIAGLQIGDRILAVDSHNISAAKELYELCQEKFHIKLMVERMAEGSGNAVQKKHSKPKDVVIRIPIPSNARLNSTTNRISSVVGNSENHSSSQQPNSETQVSRSYGTKSTERTIRPNTERIKSTPSNLPRLEMPTSSSLSNWTVDTSNISNVNNSDSKKTLAGLLGEPEDRVSFSHHSKNKRNNEEEDEDEGPTYTYRSILDVCPEGAMLLSVAGIAMHSADFRD